MLLLLQESKTSIHMREHHVIRVREVTNDTSIEASLGYSHALVVQFPSEMVPHGSNATKTTEVSIFVGTENECFEKLFQVTRALATDGIHIIERQLGTIADEAKEKTRKQVMEEITQLLHPFDNEALASLAETIKEVTENINRDRIEKTLADEE